MPLLAWLTLLTLVVVRVDHVVAQDQAGLRDREPRFYAMASGRREPQPISATSTPILARRIAVDLDDVTLDEALRTITKQAGFELAYSTALVPPKRRVRLKAQEISVAGALSEVLRDLGVDVLFSAARKAVLLRRGSFPEQSAVTGRITDAQTHLPITGAEVFLAWTSWRAFSDSSGRYALTEVTPGSYTLTARRLGYAKQEQAVVLREGQEDTVDVTMEPRATRLDELVTTATGERRRLDIANDVTTINADSVMQAAPIRSVTDLLENRVPGLTVQHTSGAPGDPSRLRLRGTSSPLRGNDPIVIVDGIRVYSDQSADRSGNLAIGDGTGLGAAPSPLDYIDPATIDKVEILKGPSAATLYGPDAANGVIVITTKKGRPGPTRWTASLSHNQTQMAESYPELLYHAGHSVFNSTSDNCPVSQIGLRTGLPCVGDSLVPFQLLNDPALTVLDHGYRTAASLGASGGTQALTYNVIGSYANEVGLIKLPAYEADHYQSLLGVAPPDWMRRPQNFKQWSAMSSLTAHLGSKADVSLQAQVSHTGQQKSSLQSQLGTLMSTYLDQATGQYYTTPQDLVLNNFVVSNPITQYYQRVTDAATSFTNNVSMSYHPWSWLPLSADAGINVIQRTDQAYTPRGPNVGSPSSPDTVGALNEGHGSSVVSTVNLRGTAIRQLGRGFQFQFAMGVNYREISTNDLSAISKDLAPGSSLRGNTGLTWTRNETSDATFGWYAEPSIGNSKFNFSSGLRLDGGGLYGTSISGLSLPKFPKLGFSYLVSDESWFPLKDLVQSLRLRVSYGRASRQPLATDRLRLYTVPKQVYTGDQYAVGTQLQDLGNTEVRPERSSEFEGGFDVDILDSRISLGVTGFRKTTDDALLPVPLAPSVYGSGVSTIKNIGVTRNTGLELTVEAQMVRSGPVTWAANLNLTRRRDMVVELASGLTPFYTYGQNAANTASQSSGIISGLRIAPGYPIDGRWSRPILGYADANGDGVLQPEEVQLGDTAVYVGSTEPNYQIGFGTMLSLWHGALTLNATLAYVDGLAQRNEAARGVAAFSAGQQVAGTSLAEQEATLDMTNNNLFPAKQTDYNWIQVTSTTRFQTFSLRYTVPAAFAQRLGAQLVSVAVQGSNLGLWTNYRGLDPNVNAYGTGNNLSDNGVLPQPRLWQIEVRATY